MDSLRKFIDKNITPHVQPGGKYEKMRTTWDALDTFLFVPNHTTKNGTHIRDGIDLKRTMDHVIKALVPCLIFGIWNVGYNHYMAVGEQVNLFQELLYGLLIVGPIIITSYVAGLAVEFIFATIRNEQINEGFLVTGMLIPLIVPPTVPLWMVATATIFAVVIGKEAFGGTGMNILNVALTARVFLFFAYPKQMSGDNVWISGVKPEELAEKGQTLVDGFTGATPLGQAVENGTQIVNTAGNWLHFNEFFMGFIPGSIGETSVIACLLGAVILIVTGIGSWRIMASVVIGGLVGGYIFNTLFNSGGFDNQLMSLPAYYHLAMGGFAFGLVYMATDPVTAAQTNKGKWIYGFLIGLLAVLVRVVNPAYPEGMMLAILLMNVFAPLIDYFVVQGNIKRRLSRG